MRFFDYADKANITKPTAADQRIMRCLDQGYPEGDGYFDDMITNERTFEVWKQLSVLRTGLLSWYPFHKDSRVLEIGAGYGALTGVLCDRCKSVSATERVPHRARALARRWEHKENLSVYAGEWSGITFDAPFDVIVLTGVLERAGDGSKENVPYSEYLRRLSGLLTPTGKILVSVENRFGLKYISGAVDPHTHRAFDGIAGYRRGARGISFDRQQMIDILHAAGYDAYRFYYPLPDYLFPQIIYSDEYLIDHTVGERLLPYYTRNDTLIAEESALYNVVANNGVFPFVANSFLIEAARLSDAGSAHRESDQKAADRVHVIYGAVSSDRGPDRAYATTIRSDQTVSKAPLFEESRQGTQRLYESITELEKRHIPVVPHTIDKDGVLVQPRILYPTFSEYLKSHSSEITEDVFVDIIDRFQEYIMRASDVADGEENALLSREIAAIRESEEVPEKLKKRIAEVSALDFGPILRKAYTELISMNCFINPETLELQFFDQEFVRENYPAKYVMFRLIFFIYLHAPGTERIYPRQKLIERYGLEALWDVFQHEEDRFQRENRNIDKYAQFYRWMQIDFKRLDENPDRLVSEEEIIANYRVSERMKHVWNIELAMFDEFVRICEKYNLTYYMVHGSLLGAIRHRGFIPWDDDMDVAMKRADYDRFLEVAEKELVSPLSLQTMYSDEEVYFGPIARIRNAETTGITQENIGHGGNHGIWMDILPLDFYGQNEKQMGRKQKAIRRAMRLLQAKVYGNDTRRAFDLKEAGWARVKREAERFSHRELCEMLDKAVRMYTEEETQELCIFTGYDFQRRLFAEDFAETAELEFMDRMITAPAGYDHYMKSMWGNEYLKYPPESERKPHHNGIWDPEHPFTYYQDMLNGMFDGAEEKTMIVFGAGIMLEDYMEKYGARYRPEFLVDNDKAKWGRARFGIPIREPGELLKVPDEERHLIICSYYYREIMQQLDDMGITNYKIYVQHPEWITRTETER